MLAIAIISVVLAAVSVTIAFAALTHSRRAVTAAESSLAQAKRSADAAERSAGAATITADADKAEDHRQRTPRLVVTVDAPVGLVGTDSIYRVTNEGPANLESVVVHRPILGEVEGMIRHQVARTGGDYDEQAEIGPVPVGAYGRFTLAIGPKADLPDFRVRIVSCAGDEAWESLVALDKPRRPPRQSRAYFQ